MFIDKATFAKRAYVGKIIYLWDVAFQPSKWLVPVMVGMGGGVASGIRVVEWGLRVEEWNKGSLIVYTPFWPSLWYCSS